MERRCYIFGCYLSADNISTIYSAITALKELPWGDKLLVAGDLNVNLAEPEGDWRVEEIVAALTTEGLEDILAHFFPRRIPW